MTSSRSPHGRGAADESATGRSRARTRSATSTKSEPTRAQSKDRLWTEVTSQKEELHRANQECDAERVISEEHQAAAAAAHRQSEAANEASARARLECHEQADRLRECDAETNAARHQARERDAEVTELRRQLDQARASHVDGRAGDQDSVSQAAAQLHQAGEVEKAELRRELQSLRRELAERQRDPRQLDERRDQAFDDLQTELLTARGALLDHQDQSALRDELREETRVALDISRTSELRFQEAALAEATERNRVTALRRQLQLAESEHGDRHLRAASAGSDRSEQRRRDPRT